MGLWLALLFWLRVRVSIMVLSFGLGFGFWIRVNVRKVNKGLNHCVLYSTWKVSTIALVIQTRCQSIMTENEVSTKQVLKYIGWFSDTTSATDSVECSIYLSTVCFMNFLKISSSHLHPDVRFGGSLFPRVLIWVTQTFFILCRRPLTATAPVKHCRVLKTMQVRQSR